MHINFYSKKADGLQTKLHLLEQVHEVKVPYNMVASWITSLVLGNTPAVIHLAYGNGSNSKGNGDTNMIIN